MKAIKDMVLREIAGEHILIPVGRAAERLYGFATLNDSALFLWRQLSEGERSEAQLVEALLDEYEVDRAEAEADVAAFLCKMKEASLIEPAQEG